MIKNALPFASANDPRIPVTGATNNTTRKAFDGSTPWVGQLLYGQTDPFPVLTGIDARLIEAEAKINTGDFAGMFATLNALRTSAQTIGSKTIAAMPALTTAPTTKDAALTLFFREKAFWQFGRGFRHGRSATADPAVRPHAGQRLPGRDVVQGRHVRHRRQPPDGGHGADEPELPRLSRSQPVVIE